MYGDIIQAIEYVEKPIELGASQWILVKAEDDIVYQVKFNQSALFCNINEFLGNYIGVSIGVPVPDGLFLMVPDNILDEASKKLGYTINMDTVRENIFFATKWIYGQVKFNNMNLLLDEIGNTANYNEYPSIFPYDQYLRNQDRHIDNHLIIRTNDKQKFYYSIDSDRIFESYPLSDILSVKDNFECFERSIYKDLYDSITDELYDIILRYSDLIEKLTDEQFDLMVEYLDSYYDIELSLRENVEEFMKYRKNDFSQNCLKNQDCFKKIKQKVLIR